MQITEKVSPNHPDKVADRIAGALVDYCYKKQKNPKCAFEVLVGHGYCFITAESSVRIPSKTVSKTVKRITKEKEIKTYFVDAPQDTHLENNQKAEIRCGDNGVFAGFPMPVVHTVANKICKKLYKKYPYDGKIVLNDDIHDLTICWSKTSQRQIRKLFPGAGKVNPIGDWTGGINVDTGVTGRKLASDFYGIEKPLGGGTMHGKDLSKADVSVNIYCYLEAKKYKIPVKAICSIGDIEVNVNGVFVKYAKIVETARKYIKKVGGFEKFACWGLQ